MRHFLEENNFKCFKKCALFEPLDIAPTLDVLVLLPEARYYGGVFCLELGIATFAFSALAYRASSAVSK